MMKELNSIIKKCTVTINENGIIKEMGMKKHVEGKI